MDILIKGLEPRMARWLVNVLGRGACEFQREGAEHCSLKANSVLGAILTDTAAFGQSLAGRIEEQRTADPSAVPDRIVVDLAPAPENVVHVKFG